MGVLIYFILGILPSLLQPSPWQELKGGSLLVSIPMQRSHETKDRHDLSIPSLTERLF